MTTKITFPYKSKSGFSFNIHLDYIESIESLIDEVRTEIVQKKKAGKFIGYLSVPLSSRGGGDFTTNTAMAKKVAERVQKEFGSDLWILNPAVYNLPKGAAGGDYMAVWSDVLAGKDGFGTDFDMVYFVGPNDVWNFFEISGENRLGCIMQWLINESKKNQDYLEILNNEERRRDFLRYYGIRGSVAYSKGGHDEWNIVSVINQKRETGSDIAVYFDGHPIEPGDYDDPTEFGYQIIK